MRWRRAILRFLLLLLLAAPGVGYWIYTRLTDPTVVRAKVLEELQSRLPGAAIELDAAQLHLFSGLHLHNLRFARKDASGQEPFATVPEAVLHHDKQRLSRGELLIRRVELRRPTLKIMRRADGTLNLAGLAAPSDGQPPPIIQIEQASVQFCDEKLGQSIEITNLDAQINPADAGKLTILATGKIEGLGDFQLDALLDTKSGDLTVKGNLAEFAVDAALWQRLSVMIPEAKEYAEVIHGQGTLNGELAYHPGSRRPLSYAVQFQLTHGRIQHPCLLFPIENVELSLRCDGGRAVLDRFQGVAAGAPVSATAELDAIDPDADFRARLKLHRFHVKRDYYTKVSPRLKELCDAFQPEGYVSIDAEVHRRKGELGIRYTLSPDDLGIVFDDFPYPLKEVSGTLAYSEDNNDPRLRVNLTGHASGQPVRIVGDVFGDGLRLGVDLKPGHRLTITAGGIPIDQTAFDALKLYPGAHKELSEFHFTGQVGVRCETWRDPARPREPIPQPQHRLWITMQDGTMNYDRFPYPLEEINGTVEIHLPEESWHFKEMRAKHKKGLFAAAGAGKPTPQGDHIRLAIRGVSIQLDQEMEYAIGPRMKEAWDLFCPEGPVDFVARVELIGGQKEPDVDLELTARGLRMKPPCFPFELTDVKGTFRYAKGIVRLQHFQALHGDCKLTLGDESDKAGGGGVIVRPGGGFRAELRQIRAEPLTVDRDFLAALPERVREVFATLKPDQPIRLVTDLTIDAADGGGPTIYEWDGHVAFLKSKLFCGVELENLTGLVALRGAYDGKRIAATGNLQIDEVALAGLPFQKVRGKLEIVDDLVTLKGLIAELHGGEVYGKIVADIQPDLAYAIDLTASKIDLAKYARKGLGRRGQVHGLAYGRLSLAGKGSDLAKLRGSGEFSVPDGKLYDLPLIVDVLSFLSGYLPNGTAFNEADARFTIAGETITFSQITLLGDALSLRGQGSVKADGSSLQLEMYSLIWGRAMPLLPPVIDAIPPAISKSLMQIKVQGSVDKTKLKIEPVPVLVEPVKDLLQFLSRRQRTDAGK